MMISPYYFGPPVLRDPVYSIVISQVHENNRLKFDVLSKGFASKFNQVIFMQAGYSE
jgi:hypothetical protein